LQTILSTDEDHSDWLSTHFPPLEDTILVSQKFQGLNALEFFSVFFGDDAPFSFQEFQRKRGDIDIEYGKWTPARNDAPKFQHLERDISFKTLTKSYFGPPYAICHKHQEVYLHKRLFILECQVRLEGIPFCDRFSVKERWVLEAPKSTSGDTKVATLAVNSQVYFLQPCAFEQQIHTKSQSTLREVVSSWCHMAQQALQLTIQQKLEREQREASMVVDGDVDSIEVAHSYSSGKSIVLGDDENVPPTDYPPMVVVAAQDALPRKQPLQNFKRSVLQRIVKKNMQ
jgi:hypothetical protein